MLSTDHKRYAEELGIYVEQAFSETPFVGPGAARAGGGAIREASLGETFTGNQEFNISFLSGESTGAESLRPQRLASLLRSLGSIPIRRPRYAA
jgi:hypothetical protein